MNDHGQRLMRWWKQHAPAAYDELADPTAHFEALGILVAQEVEEQVRRHLAGEDPVPVGGDVVLMPPQEVAPAEVSKDLVRDPRGDYVGADGMPRYAHRLWRLLDDPTVSAAYFQSKWTAWLEAVPVVERSVLESPDEAAWSLTSDTNVDTLPESQRPLLLLDIDGCLSPLKADTGSKARAADADVDPVLAAGIASLADRYELAWATTWEDLAHVLGSELGWPRMPVVPVLSSRSHDPDGWDSRKVGPILDYVGQRPFAWVDDLVSREDADRLSQEQTCLIIRPDPAVGLAPDHLDLLRAWAAPWAGRGTAPAVERRPEVRVGRQLLTTEMAQVLGFPGRDNEIRRDVLRRTLESLADDRERYTEQAATNLASWREQAPARSGPPLVTVLPGDWGEVAAILTRRYGECFAVLNMANAHVPGGAYVEGGAAQEENMFRRSDCHFSISDSVYDADRDLYRDHMTRLLEAEDGKVFLDTAEPRVCVRGPEDRSLEDLGYRWLPDDEIFPFYELRAAARDMRDGSSFDQADARRRIRAQFSTLIDHGVRHVVLGAFGCGAFRNPSDLVAEIYRDEIATHLDSFDVIAFAVFNAGYGPSNFVPFKRVIETTR